MPENGGRGSLSQREGVRESAITLQAATVFLKTL
jgi:hypothetical protein